MSMLKIKNIMLVVFITFTNSIHAQGVISDLVNQDDGLQRSLDQLRATISTRSSSGVSASYLEKFSLDMSNQSKEVQDHIKQLNKDRELLKEQLIEVNKKLDFVDQESNRLANENFKLGRGNEKLEKAKREADEKLKKAKDIQVFLVSGFFAAFILALLKLPTLLPERQLLKLQAERIKKELEDTKV